MVEEASRPRNPVPEGKESEAPLTRQLLPHSSFTSHNTRLMFGTNPDVIKKALGVFGVRSHLTSAFQSVASPNPFESLRESLRAWVGFQFPAEQIECRKVLDALEEGDEAPFWQFVEKQLGRPPDDLLLEVLDRYFLPHGGDIPTWVVLRLLDHHGRRLTYRKPEEWYNWLAGQVYLRLRKKPTHRLMRALSQYSESLPERLERLKAELPQAVQQAEREGFFGGYFGTSRNWHNKYMLGDVERQIVLANRSLRDTRNRQKRGDDEWDMVVSLEVLSEQECEQFLSAPDLEEAFTELEDERRERRRSTLSKQLPPKELELVRFWRFVYDPEKHGDSLVGAAAQYLGKSPSAVRSQVHRMKQHFAS